jgi:FAD/FMN-containing dehydrogenase
MSLKYMLEKRKESLFVADMRQPQTPTRYSEINELRKYLLAAGCTAFEAGTDGYVHSTRIWNAAVQHEPALVARCLTTHDVQLSLSAAQAHGFQISVRGGGHDWVGRSVRHGGLVLDLSGMPRVSVDVEAKEATVAGGATVMNVSDAVAATGLAAVTGFSGGTGMAGLLLGGGYGPLMPRFGLAADNLIAAEVVLADGRLVTADESQNVDLFWALRGGGGNFGVVTSIRIRLHETREVLGGVVVFPWGDALPVLRGYAEIIASAPPELAVAAVMSVVNGSPVIVLAPTWSGEQKAGLQMIARLERLGTPVVRKIDPTTYGEMLAVGDAQLPGGRHYAIQTRWLRDLTPDAIRTLIAAYDARTSPFATVVLHHFHGAGARIAPDATAFGMREEHFTMFVYQGWERSADGDSVAHRAWASDLNSKLAPLALPGGYANLLSPHAEKQIAAAYGSNARRLGELKRRFDPKKVFSSAIPLPS